MQGSYDALNNQIGITNALSTNIFKYDGSGRMLFSIDGRGYGVTNVYDSSSGNLLFSTNALNQVTRYTYDTDNRLSCVSDPLSNYTTNIYDSSGNLYYTASVDSNSVVLNATTSYYDANNNKIQDVTFRTTTSGTQWMTNTYVYDGQNRLMQTIDALGKTNTTVYDNNGQQIATIDKLGHTIQYQYDPTGKLLVTTYPDFTSESSAHDANGRRTNSVDRLGRVTQYEYDAVGQLTNTIYPDLTSSGTVYDAVGRVQFSIDARGTTNAFGYDVVGRQVAVTNGFNSSISNVMAYAYDGDGNRTVTTGWVTATFAFMTR